MCSRSWSPFRLLFLSVTGLAVSLHAAPTNALRTTVATNVPRTVVPTNAAPAAAVTNAPFDLVGFDRDRILKAAVNALVTEPVTITKYHAPFTEGGTNDFYSQGESWYPNPAAPNGLPFHQQPGTVNPDIFTEHRKCLTQLRDNVAALAAAYKLTGNSRYATVAAEWLRVFFVDPATRMKPNLNYAEAVPGVYRGRSIGTSDTVPMAEVAKAIKAVQDSPGFPENIRDGVKQWSSDYLEWLMTSTNGDDVANMGNNHSVVYWLQVAAFAELVGDQDQLTTCRTRFKSFLLPQVGADGAFTRVPKARTYVTVLCVSEELADLCQIISTSDDDLWHFTTPAGRTLRANVDYIAPYLEDKTRWSKTGTDIGDSEWPVRQGSLLFASLALDEPKYLSIWKRLPADPTDYRVRWDMVVTQPILWVK